MNVFLTWPFILYMYVSAHSSLVLCVRREALVDGEYFDGINMLKVKRLICCPTQVKSVPPLMC